MNLVCVSEIFVSEHFWKDIIDRINAGSSLTQEFSPHFILGKIVVIWTLPKAAVIWIFRKSLLARQAELWRSLSSTRIVPCIEHFLIPLPPHLCIRGVESQEEIQIIWELFPVISL